MRYQELIFSASVLGAAIALHYCRHPGDYVLLQTADFPARNLRALAGAPILFDLLKKQRPFHRQFHCGSLNL